MKKTKYEVGYKAPKKSTKEEAGYQPPSEAPFHCVGCKHFQGRLQKENCEEVEGHVDPEGCCDYYKKRRRTTKDWA